MKSEGSCREGLTPSPGNAFTAGVVINVGAKLV
jgi:hypothetical protein